MKPRGLRTLKKAGFFLLRDASQINLEKPFWMNISDPSSAFCLNQR